MARMVRAGRRHVDGAGPRPFPRSSVPRRRVRRSRSSRPLPAARRRIAGPLDSRDSRRAPGRSRRGDGCGRARRGGPARAQGRAGRGARGLDHARVPRARERGGRRRPRRRRRGRQGLLPERHLAGRPRRRSTARRSSSTWATATAGRAGTATRSTRPPRTASGSTRSAAPVTTAHQYFGEASIENLQLAPNAVVVFSHLCYASGNTEPGLPEGSRGDAIQRVDNYASGFLRAGAGRWSPRRPGARVLRPVAARATAAASSRSGAARRPPTAPPDRDPSERTPGYTVRLDPERAGVRVPSLARVARRDRARAARRRQGRAGSRGPASPPPAEPTPRRRRAQVRRAGVPGPAGRRRDDPPHAAAGPGEDGRAPEGRPGLGPLGPAPARRARRPDPSYHRRARARGRPGPRASRTRPGAADARQPAAPDADAAPAPEPPPSPTAPAEPVAPEVDLVVPSSSARSSSPSRAKLDQARICVLDVAYPTRPACTGSSPRSTRPRASPTTRRPRRSSRRCSSGSAARSPSPTARPQTRARTVSRTDVAVRVLNAGSTRWAKEVPRPASTRRDGDAASTDAHASCRRWSRPGSPPTASRSRPRSPCGSTTGRRGAGRLRRRGARADGAGRPGDVPPAARRRGARPGPALGPRLQPALVRVTVGDPVAPAPAARSRRPPARAGRGARGHRRPPRRWSSTLPLPATTEPGRPRRSPAAPCTSTQRSSARRCSTPPRVMEWSPWERP